MTKTQFIPVSDWHKQPAGKVKQLFTQSVKLTHRLIGGQWCYVFTFKNVAA